MGSSDRTAHDLCRPIRSPQDVTSLRRTRNHLFWLTMGLAPFDFTISNNSANTHSITIVLGLDDGKLCTLCLDTSAVTLHFQSRTPFPILRWGARVRYCAKSFTSVLKRPSATSPVSYCAHPVKPPMAEKYISSRTV